MRPKVKWAILGAFVCAAAGVMYWQNVRAERIEERNQAFDAATAALHEMTRVDREIAPEVRKRLIDIGVAAMLGGAEKAGKGIERDLIPLLDRYVVAADRAVALGDAYLALADEPVPSFDKIRAAARAARANRDRFIDLRRRIAAGAVAADQIADELGRIGWASIIDDAKMKSMP
jgi:hypothetical protein